MVKPPTGNRARRSALLTCAVAAMLALGSPVAGQQIVPADFFSRVPVNPAGQMAVSADTMVFDQASGTVTAQGNVGIAFEGYRATADRAVYYQRTGRVELVGNVAFIDPEGVEYVADRIELEDGFREGFLRALTVAFPDGTRFTAAETSFDQGVERVYIEGTYLPCGTCIDARGNTIGWTVKAARIVTDETDQTIYFEQPSLQLLGTTVLALPWLTLPADEDLEFPVLSVDSEYGVGISLPFFRYRVADASVLVTPTIYTNQGVGVKVDWRQSVGDLSYGVSASGVYQLNPGAYTGLADRNARGAIQTDGTYRPTDEWTLGWSYTAFTDPGYLPDYRIASGTARNQVYARYLDTDTYGDIRFQQFVPLDNQPDESSFQTVLDRQALTHPNAQFDHVVDLEDGAGRFEIAGRLLGLTRVADHAGSGYAYGYEGQSVHAMVQANWTNQYIVPGGLVVSPYLGVRADGASYDGASALPGAPVAQSLFALTPIAALDIRYPLLARTAGASHVIEPIAQLVYRGGPAVPGITNDDSQSFVFEDTNLFSFNRFSGADRQETGLRANVGGQVQTTFDNGGWVGAVFGQSFHLAGTNGFNASDGTPVGVGSGMNADSSYIVAGVQGGYGGLSGGAKAQLDPATGEIPRGQISTAAQANGFGLSADYVYIAENPALGTTADRHEIGFTGSLPLADYWSAKVGTAWDLSANQWLQSSAALEYDDTYLAFGIATRVTGPTHRSPNDFQIGVSFRLSAAGRREIVGLDYSFSEF